MPFLDDLLGVQVVTVEGGPPLPRRDTLNFIGVGMGSGDNPDKGQTDLYFGAGSGAALTPPPFAVTTVNDFDLGNAALQRWSSVPVDGATVHVTGLVAGSLSRVWITAVGLSTPIMLDNEGEGSAPANRMLCPGESSLALLPNTVVELIYDSVSARWRVVGAA